ncbi:MAG: TonB-dependent receptor [Phycisphaerales bacterium]|nr:TonB-dependent receptor [Phycisphaerales bacterium]
MKYFFGTLFILFLFSTITLAQSAHFTISGRIQEKNGQKLADASVALFNIDDNKFAAGNTSNDDGSFSIENVNTGKYKIRVTLLGYKENTIENVNVNADNVSLGNIVLDKSETNLKGVDIVKEKNMLEMSIDKKVFNVEKNITATGGTAADVLQNIPSVTVDANGNVSLRGKSSVNILIDGRPATLLAGDVASALQALPSASIESVEVITNPSSKYDAQGNAGIINIITKANKNQGLNGSATIGIGTRGKYNGGLNINLRKDKWNFAINSNFRVSDNFQRTTTDRKNLLNDSGSHTYGDYQRQFHGWFNSFTIGYTLNAQNTISYTQNINRMRFGTFGGQEFDLFTKPQSIYSIIERGESFKGGPNSYSSNANWKHKFKKPKQEITTDVTYSFAQSNNKQVLTTNSLDGNRNVLFGTITQEIPSNNNNRNFNAQTDFTSPFGGKEGKLEAGLKTQNFWLNTENNPTRTLPNSAPVKDLLLQNKYSYEQHNYAAYSSYSNRYKKWSYQAGLRLEYAGYAGVVGTTTTIDYSNSFLNLFPSVYVSYQLKDNQQFFLNYSKRIDRPNFMKMMPYFNIANALDTSSGNPNLKPEFINNFEFSYNIQLPKGNTIMASLYYQKTANLTQNFTKIYSDGTSFSQPVNLSSGSTYGFELTAKTQMTKAWDATISANLFQNNIDGANVDPSISNEGFSWFSKLNTNYKLNKQVSFQLMGNYESAKPAAQGRLQEVYWFDAAVKANFLKNNKASIVLNITDIFNTRKYTTNYNLPLYYQSIYRDRETQIATITFTYKFGKTEWGDKNPGEGGGRGRRSRQNNPEIKKDLKERDSNLKTGEEDGGSRDGGGGK